MEIRFDSTKFCLPDFSYGVNSVEICSLLRQKYPKKLVNLSNLTHSFSFEKVGPKGIVDFKGRVTLDVSFKKAKYDEYRIIAMQPSLCSRLLPIRELDDDFFYNYKAF